MPPAGAASAAENRRPAAAENPPPPPPPPPKPPLPLPAWARARSAQEQDEDGGQECDAGHARIVVRVWAEAGCDNGWSRGRNRDPSPPPRRRASQTLIERYDPDVDRRAGRQGAHPPGGDRGRRLGRGDRRREARLAPGLGRGARRAADRRPGHLEPDRPRRARRDDRLPAGPPDRAAQPAPGHRLPGGHERRSTEPGRLRFHSVRTKTGSVSVRRGRASASRCWRCTAWAGPRPRSCPRWRPWRPRATG